MPLRVIDASRRSSCCDYFCFPQLRWPTPQVGWRQATAAALDACLSPGDAYQALEQLPGGGKKY